MLQPVIAQNVRPAHKEFATLAKQATSAREANRNAEAIDLYKRALALDPRWDEGWWYLGTLYYEGDQYGPAVAAFRNLVELTPKLGPAWAMLGLCEFETNDLKNSLIHLERGRGLGLAGHEELVNVTLYHLALLLNLKGDFESATELLSSLAARGVYSNSVKTALGMASLRAPLLPTQVDPSKDALIHAAGEAALLVATSNFDQADTAYRELLKDFPGTPFLHYAYGSMLASTGRYDDAEREFREEIKITPESALPYMQLAYIELRMRRNQQALPLAAKAVKTAPQSFAAHYLLGRTLLELGEIEPSIRELETARRFGPFSPEVRYSLARAYGKAKRIQEAERERAEFARLNALLERQQRQSQGQSYRTSSDRGALEPHVVREPSSAPQN